MKRRIMRVRRDVAQVAADHLHWLANLLYAAEDPEPPEHAELRRLADHIGRTGRRGTDVQLAALFGAVVLLS